MRLSFPSRRHPGTNPALCAAGWDGMCAQSSRGGRCSPGQPIQLHPTASLCKPARTQLSLCRAGCDPTVPPLSHNTIPALKAVHPGLPCTQPSIGGGQGKAEGKANGKMPIAGVWEFPSSPKRAAASRALLLQLRCRVSPSPWKAAPSSPAAGGAPLLPAAGMDARMDGRSDGCSEERWEEGGCEPEGGGAGRTGSDSLREKKRNTFEPLFAARRGLNIDSERLFFPRLSFTPPPRTAQIRDLSLFP